MIYGEIGAVPLAVEIKSRRLSFWSKMIETEQDNIYKLSPLIYRVIYALHTSHRLKSQWLDSLKTLICSLGFAGIWYSQSFSNRKWFVKASTQKLKDVFIQDWFAVIGISSSSNIYRIFKTKFEQSPYLSILSFTIANVSWHFEPEIIVYQSRLGDGGAFPYKKEPACIVLTT